MLPSSFTQSSILPSNVGVILLALVLIRSSTAQEVSIEPTGEITKVAGDFAFTEGPAWDPTRKVIYFTDIPNATIHIVDQDGNLSDEPLTKDSKHSNGLLITADGRLLACQMDGQVVDWGKDRKTATIVADEFGGHRFNACNDLIVDQDGGIYFTDPLFRAPTPLPQEIQAVYYIANDKTVRRVTEHIAAPNGIALSPDGKTLYVIPSLQAEMLAYDVTAPGELSNQRVFCTVKQPDGETKTGGDGMVVDVRGNVYLTTHLGIQIFTPSGQAAGIVTFPEHPANVTFGDDDRKTLYVTARTGLYKVRMPFAGLPPN